MNLNKIIYHINWGTELLKIAQQLLLILSFDPKSPDPQANLHKHAHTHTHTHTELFQKIPIKKTYVVSS